MPKKRPHQLIKGPHGGVELVLTQNVAGLGKPGDVVEVKPGFARNYLLPQGLATRATPYNLRLIERNKQKAVQLVKQQREEVERLALELAKHSVSIEASANQEGHLYGSVGEQDIAEALQNDQKPVTPEMVRLEGHIKELGLYSVKLQLDVDVESEIKVWVVPASESSEE